MVIFVSLCSVPLFITSTAKQTVVVTAWVKSVCFKMQWGHGSHCSVGPLAAVVGGQDTVSD